MAGTVDMAVVIAATSILTGAIHKEATTGATAPGVPATRIFRRAALLRACLAQIPAGFFMVAMRSTAFKTMVFTSAPCSTVSLISDSGARAQSFL
jgi:hypothetical protein